jgi:hypothetical protein
MVRNSDQLLFRNILIHTAFIIDFDSLPTEIGGQTNTYFVTEIVAC